MKKRQSRTASDYELGKRKGTTPSDGGSGDSSSMSYDKRTASTRALIVRTLIVRQNSNASLGTPDDDDDDDSSKKGSLKTSPPVVKNKLASETVLEIFPRSTPTGRKEGRTPDAPTCSARDPFSASLEIGKKRAETVVNQLRYPPSPRKEMLILRAQAQSCLTASQEFEKEILLADLNDWLQQKTDTELSTQQQVIIAILVLIMIRTYIYILYLALVSSLTLNTFQTVSQPCEVKESNTQAEDSSDDSDDDDSDVDGDYCSAQDLINKYFSNRTREEDEDGKKRDKNKNDVRRRGTEEHEETGEKEEEDEEQMEKDELYREGRREKSTKKQEMVELVDKKNKVKLKVKEYTQKKEKATSSEYQTTQIETVEETIVTKKIKKTRVVKTRQKPKAKSNQKEKDDDDDDDEASEEQSETNQTGQNNCRQDKQQEDKNMDSVDCSGGGDAAVHYNHSLSALPPSPSSKRVTIFDGTKSSAVAGGKVIVFHEKDTDWTKFIQTCVHKLNLAAGEQPEKQKVRVFLGSGGEVDSLECIRDNDTLYITK